MRVRDPGRVLRGGGRRRGWRGQLSRGRGRGQQGRGDRLQGGLGQRHLGLEEKTILELVRFPGLAENHISKLALGPLRLSIDCQVLSAIFEHNTKSELKTMYGFLVR